MSAYQFQEFFLLPAGKIYKSSVLHFYLPALTLNIPFDKLKIDDMRVMCTEKHFGQQKVFKFLKRSAGQYSCAFCKINSRVVALGLQY